MGRATEAADVLYGVIQLDAPARHVLTRAHADYLAAELDRAGLLAADEVVEVQA